MTIKKSLISVAAASLLAAGFAGCGSDSSSTPAAATTDTTTTTTSGVVSSVQAVDGYVYNATAKAYYLADNNTSMTAITLTATPTTKDVVSGVVTVGQSTYSLPADTNASVKSRIKFYTISDTVSSSVGTTFTPAAYIEGNNIDGYDANDTLLGTTVLYSPANSAIISPLTNLIYTANSASLFGATTAVPTTLVDLNATTFTALEANATKIATNLGLTGVNLLTADPVALAATNPTLRLVTALLKGADSTTATTILAMTTPATTLATTLTAVAAALPAGDTGKTLATTLAASAANGGFSTSDIAGLNIEKSVTAGSVQSLVAPVTTGLFPINGISINGKDSTEFVAAGAKISSTLADIYADINMSKVDGNITNKAFNVFIAVKGNKSFVASTDSNKSGSLIVQIPFDLNSTTSVIDSLVDGNTAIKYEAKSSDGAYIVTKSDVNATILSLTGDTAINTTAVSNVVRIHVGTILDNLKDKSADANLTGDTGFAFDGITDVQVYLTDAANTVGLSADGLNSMPLAKGTFSSLAGTVAATEAIKILNLSTVDFRGITTTGANVKPANVLSLTGTRAGTGANTSAWIVNNNTEINVSLGANVTDTFEKNNTVTITSSSTADLDLNTTTLITKAKANEYSTVGNRGEFNTTNITTVGDLNYTITTVVTDEFGEANTTVNYVTANRPAYVNTSAAWSTSSEGNKTILIKDYDGRDSNASLETTSMIRILDNANKYHTLVAGTAKNVQVGINDINFTNYSVGAEKNITFSVIFNVDGSLELNSTFGTEANLTDINFSVVDYNLTDRYGMDYNLTGSDSTGTDKNVSF